MSAVVAYQGKRAKSPAQGFMEELISTAIRYVPRSAAVGS